MLLRTLVLTHYLRITDTYIPLSQNIDLNRSNLETRDGTKIQLQAGMTITTNLKLRDNG